MTDPKAVTEAMTFKDLGLDDREFVEMILAIEDKFNFQWKMTRPKVS